jgi:hypothetical protein
MAMTQENAARRKTVRQELGRYVPRQFNPLTRERFLRDRRRRHLARVPTASPSDEQAATIQSLASLEWAALASEADGSLQGLREAREHRRLFQRLLGDFERSLAVPPPRGPTRPAVDRRQLLNDYLERREAEEAA